MKTSDVLRVLLRARALLCRGWCRGAMARDERGSPVDPAGPAAVAWCLSGAIDAAVDIRCIITHSAAWRACAYQCGRRYLQYMNDDAPSVSVVLAVVDRAIRRVAGSRWPL